MKSIFRKSFARDLKKIKDRELLDRIRATIVAVEAASNLHQINELKKIVGANSFYRIRVGDYRIGIAAEGGSVEFIRCLPRRELYRFFP